MDKERFDIIYKHFAKPISNMAMTYKHSAMTVDRKMVHTKVSKCFDALVKALSEQLDSYR